MRHTFHVKQTARTRRPRGCFHVEQWPYVSREFADAEGREKSGPAPPRHRTARRSRAKPTRNSPTSSAARSTKPLHQGTARASSQRLTMPGPRDPAPPPAARSATRASTPQQARQCLRSAPSCQHDQTSIPEISRSHPKIGLVADAISPVAPARPFRSTQKAESGLPGATTKPWIGLRRPNLRHAPSASIGFVAFFRPDPPCPSTTAAISASHHLDDIAGRARDIRHDRRLAPRQEVQQGRFSHIWWPDDRHPQPIARMISPRRPSASSPAISAATVATGTIGPARDIRRHRPPRR